MTTTVPTLRADLQFSSQQHLGKNYTVVKDPLTRRYFRFTEGQNIILGLLNEPRELDWLAARASAALGGNIQGQTIQSFLKSLEEKLLLDTEDVRDKLERYPKRKNAANNYLYWKVASVNPERIFAWLLPRTHWAFTRSFHLFAVFIIVTALVLNYQHLNELKTGVYQLISLNGLLLAWVVTLGVVTLHEFAHGITCCHFGGKVHEMGFMLIYFQPAYYCDVSDSWMFPAKAHRLWVTFAGGYFQLVVWAVCTVLWRVTDPGTLVNHIATVVIVFAGFQTFINFNPLIKLDGYYMLSDFLEIPNLRQKAVQSLWDGIRGRPRPNITPRESRARLIYGIATVVFSTSLLIYVYSALYTWATSRYAFAGLVGFMLFSTYTLRRTASESIAGIRAVAARTAVRRVRNIAILGAALLIAVVGRWELKIPAEFHVIARSEMTVRPETRGTIVEIPILEGQRVARGDLLARLRDFDKEQRLSSLNGDLNKKNGELALLQAGARKEEIERKEAVVNTKLMELENVARNQEQRNLLEQSLLRKKSELDLDQRNLARSRELDSNGLLPRSELERVETAVRVREREIGEIEASIRVVSENAGRDTDLKKLELAEARSELRLMMAGARPEQIRQVEADIQRLKQEVHILKEELTKTEVRAPIDGIVTTPYVQQKLNQRLEAGDELCRIVDLSRVTIEMQVPEKEMADVRSGNPVMLRMRSFPLLDLKGRVDFIAPVAQTVGNQQMVVVRSEMPNDALILKSDLTGVAWIYCGERRIIELMSRRFIRWFRTEFWDLLP
jgi:putative peptide zinc metalloprotease protein